MEYFAFIPKEKYENIIKGTYNKDYYKNKEYIKVSNKHRKPKIYKD
jgi:hypothetical protein